MSDTTKVWHEEGVEAIHLATLGVNETRTRCGLDTSAMRYEERPTRWAAVWCADCMRKAVGA